MEITLLILFLALLIDRYLGDPDWLWTSVPHPVVVFGKAISFIDRRFNREGETAEIRKRNGIAAMTALLAVSVLTGLLVMCALRSLGVVGFIAETAGVAVMLAQKSLRDHVDRVALGLREGGLAGGRAAVAMIVGRDPQSLDEAAVSRAAIESLAENSSDGIVAPAFWYIALGLPGLFAYKMLNTADSMIGHMNPRYRAFGWFAAKADDVANWIPARLTGGLIALSAWFAASRETAVTSFNVMMRDARLHRSPNAGWPESAMAGALGLALAGPRIYSGDIANEPMLNGAGRREAGPRDIDAAIRIFDVMTLVLPACVLLLFIAAL